MQAAASGVKPGYCKTWSSPSVVPGPCKRKWQKADSDQVMALLGCVNGIQGGKYGKKQPKRKRENITVFPNFCAY